MANTKPIGTYYETDEIYTEIGRYDRTVVIIILKKKRIETISQRALVTNTERGPPVRMSSLKKPDRTGVVRDFRELFN